MHIRAILSILVCLWHANTAKRIPTCSEDGTQYNSYEIIQMFFSLSKGENITINSNTIDINNTDIKNVLRNNSINERNFSCINDMDFNGSYVLLVLVKTEIKLGYNILERIPEYFTKVVLYNSGNANSVSAKNLELALLCYNGYGKKRIHSNYSKRISKNLLHFSYRVKENTIRDCEYFGFQLVRFYNNGSIPIYISKPLLKTLVEASPMPISTDVST